MKIDEWNTERETLPVERNRKYLIIRYGIFNTTFLAMSYGREDEKPYCKKNFLMNANIKHLFIVQLIIQFFFQVTYKYINIENS